MQPNRQFKRPSCLSVKQICLIVKFVIANLFLTHRGIKLGKSQDKQKIFLFCYLLTRSPTRVGPKHVTWVDSNQSVCICAPQTHFGGQQWKSSSVCPKAEKLHSTVASYLSFLSASRRQIVECLSIIIMTKRLKFWNIL